MKKKVMQRERENERLRLELQSPQTDLEIQSLAGPAIDLLRREHFQRLFRVGDHGAQVGEGCRSDERGWVEGSVSNG